MGLLYMGFWQLGKWHLNEGKTYDEANSTAASILEWPWVERISEHIGKISTNQIVSGYYQNKEILNLSWMAKSSIMST